VWKRWFVTNTWFTRPAPPRAGRPPARNDAPPDGWEPASLSGMSTLGVYIDRAVLRLADMAATEIHRREFLKRVSKAGWVACLVGSGVLFRAPRASGYAAIFDSCDPLGDPPTGPCGPSGLCASGDCSNGQCANANRKRVYGGNTCCTGCTGTDNCWRENCCNNNNWNSLVKCCDCCYNSGPGTTCTDCVGQQRRKCICRAKVGNPC